MSKSATLAKAYVQIIPSSEGIKGSLQNILDPESKNAGKISGTNIASTIKKVLVGAGIGTALKSALSEGANLQQSLGGVETLFKEHADVVKKYATQAYETAGVSANDYMEQVTSFSASLLNSLGGDTAKAADAANQAIIDMADNSNKMGTSLEMIQNAYQGFAKQNYTMLDNLKLGYGGTKEEMKRLLKDAQKITGIKYDIGNLNDVYSAIHVIQDELGITGTTADEAKKTMTGSFQAMKSALKNFIGNLALGKDVVPSLKALVSTTSTYLFKNLLPSVWNIVKSIPTVIAQGVPLLLQEGKKLIESLINGIKNQLPQVLESGTSSLKTFIEGLLNNLPNLISSAGSLMYSLVEAILERLPQILDSAYQIVTTIVSGIIKNLPKIIETGITLIGKLASGLIKGLPNILGKVVSIYSDIRTKFKNMDWIGIGKNIISGIANGIKNAIGSLVSAAKSAASSALKGIKSFLGIHSPSKVFDTEVGQMISLGLAQGIENNTKAVTDSMKKLGDITVGMAQDDIGTIANGTVSHGFNNGITVVINQTNEIDSMPVSQKMYKYVVKRMGNTYEAVELKGSAA